MFRYTTKALALHFNLQNPENPGLLRRVLDKDMGLKHLVAASPAELFPELWEPVFERVAHKQLRRQLTIDADAAPDGAFTCRRCKSKKTTFVLLQTRSADEPMTAYVQCLACQSRWKQ
jgi:DNA-directed RNA polymerase subunit M/transcription elongation factor TFIIS